jgi:hypothetical protein
MNAKSNKIKDKILKGLERSHEKLISFKKERNLELVIYQDGKIIKVPGSSLT